MCDTILSKPCMQCPFRRTSTRGWLGPWNVEELLRSLAIAPFHCHKTIKEGMQSDDPSLRLCTGAAIFLNNKYERSRHPLQLEAQQQAKSVATSEDVESVFKTADEFRVHHALDHGMGVKDE